MCPHLLAARLLTLACALLLAPLAHADEALEALHKRCDGGDHKACTNVGVRFVRGAGVKANPKRVAELFAAACGAEEPVGCTNLGLLYAEGSGVTKDPAKAANLFGRGCDKGLPAACELRAQVLFHGQGVSRDRAAAAALFGQACEGGSGRACRALSSLLDQGQGVKQDLAKAETMLAKACKTGLQAACQALRTRRVPFLWRIDVKPPSFLVGLALHRASISDLPASARKAIAGCQSLIFETDSGSLDPAAVVRISTLPKTSSLRDFIDKKDHSALQRELVMTPVILDRMKPWLAYTALLLKWRPITKSLQSQLVASSRRSGKRLTFLESPMGLLRIVDHIAAAEWAKALHAALADPAAVRKNLDAVADAFKRGDAVALQRLVFDSGTLSKVSGARRALYDDRHDEWLPDLGSRLDRGGACLLLGADQFIGERGLAKRLAGRDRVVLRVVR